MTVELSATQLGSYKGYPKEKTQFLGKNRAERSLRYPSCDLSSLWRLERWADISLVVGQRYTVQSEIAKLISEATLTIALKLIDVREDAREGERGNMQVPTP